MFRPRNVAILLLLTACLSSRVHAQKFCLIACAKADLAGLEEASKNLKAGLEAFSKFDVLGVRTVLAQNDSLRGQLAAAVAMLSSAVSGPTIKTDRQVRIRLTDQRGGFQVRAWIDEEAQWFWDEQFPDPKSRPKVDIKALWEGIYSDKQLFRILPSGLPIPCPPVLSPNGPRIQARLRQVFDSSFTDFWTTHMAMPRPAEVYEKDLTEQLVTTGPHAIVLEFTPTADETGNWAISGALDAISANGNTQHLKSFTLAKKDPRFAATATGKPLPRVTMVVTVTNE